MINKKKYYIIIAGTLILTASLGTFARFHKINFNQNLSTSAGVVKSNKASIDTNIAKNEKSGVEQQTKDTKKVDVINYRVKKGDTIETISNFYGVNSTTVAVSNGISADTSLTEGQVLRFPNTNGILYKVNSDETLWDISMAYKIDIDELVKINSLDAPDKLKLNQEIIIPRAEKILAIKNNSNEKLVAKADDTKNSLSRGGSVSTVIKAFSSKIMWPLQGSISSGFGTRDGRMHTGIDIAAPYGSSIRAASDGKVIFNGWQDGYGKLVIIQHKNGLQTYYAHNSEILVNVGQTVSAGQVIAKVGTTGRTTGPHVHFEVRKNDNPDNPLKYLK